MSKVREILFVDDTPEVCQVFKILVETRCMVNVTTCGSGREALDKLSACHYDIVITDIVMPGMDGVELTNIILKRYDVPVVLITGYNSDTLPSGYADTDAVCCLSKPYTVTQIAEKVKEALKKKRDRDQKNKEDGLSKNLGRRKGDKPGQLSRTLQEMLFA